MKEVNNLSNQNLGCIPSGILVKYIKGELSGLEKNRIERHILSCEMCADELEGLSTMTNPEMVDEISLTLNLEIDRLTAKPEREMPYLGLYLKIAASLVFIIGVSTVIYFAAFRKSSLLIPDYAEMEVVDTPAAPLLESSNDEIIKNISAKDKMENQKLEVKQDNEDIGFVEKPVAKAEQEVNYDAPVIVDSLGTDESNFEVLEDEISEAIVVKETKTVVVKQFAAESIVHAAPASVERRSSLAMGGLAKKAMGADAEKSIAADEKLSYTAMKENAIRLYSKSKYIEALAIFDDMRHNHEDNDTLVYYSSLCTFHLNRFDETIRTIADLAKNSKSVFVNQAKWYYALALIEANKQDDAIIILEQILLDNSPYGAKAKNELKKLKGN